MGVATADTALMGTREDVRSPLHHWAMVVLGTSLGIAARHRVPPERRKRISQSMVLLVAGIALVRAVVQLLG